MDKRRSDELVRCILNVLHGNVCSIIQYGPSAYPVSEIAVVAAFSMRYASYRSAKQTLFHPISWLAPAAVMPKKSTGVSKSR